MMKEWNFVDKENVHFDAIKRLIDIAWNELEQIILHNWQVFVYM